MKHGPCVAYGQWTAEEESQSSRWCKLTAVLRVLAAVATKLSNMRVRWFIGNQNVARILQMGSRKAQLQAIGICPVNSAPCEVRA